MLPIALASNMAMPYFVGTIVDQLTAVVQEPDLVRNTVLSLLGISTVGAVATTFR